jgi:hypothetical protein
VIKDRKEAHIAAEWMAEHLTPSQLIGIDHAGKLYAQNVIDHRGFAEYVNAILADEQISALAQHIMESRNAH